MEDLVYNIVSFLPEKERLRYRLFNKKIAQVLNDRVPYGLHSFFASAFPVSAVGVEWSRPRVQRCHLVHLCSQQVEHRVLQKRSITLKVPSGGEEEDYCSFFFRSGLHFLFFYCKTVESIIVPIDFSFFDWRYFCDEDLFPKLTTMVVTMPHNDIRIVNLRLVQFVPGALDHLQDCVRCVTPNDVPLLLGTLSSSTFSSALFDSTFVSSISSQSAPSHPQLSRNYYARVMMCCPKQEGSQFLLDCLTVGREEEDQQQCSLLNCTINREMDQDFMDWFLGLSLDDSFKSMLLRRIIFGLELFIDIASNFLESAVRTISHAIVQLIRNFDSKLVSKHEIWLFVLQYNISLLGEIEARMISDSTYRPTCPIEWFAHRSFNLLNEQTKEALVRSNFITEILSCPVRFRIRNQNCIRWLIQHRYPYVQQLLSAT